MSIIERAAELLGPIEQPSSPSPMLGKLDPIERVVSTISGRAGFPNVSELGVMQESKNISAESKSRGIPPRPISRTTRIFEVDRNRLRRQSMITPDSARTPVAE